MRGNRVKNRKLFLKRHGARAGLSLVTLILFFSFTMMLSCNVKSATSDTAGAGLQAESSAAGSVVGTWYDEDQLLLIGATEESQEIVVGHDLQPKSVVQEREAQGQKVFGWMILRNKRVITNTSYSLESNCETHQGEKASLKLSSAITFVSDKAVFKITEDEKSVYEKLGEFDCVASLPGYATRKYQLSPDQQYLSMFEENSSEELIRLKRGQ
jgi:hypothetical protein